MPPAKRAPAKRKPTPRRGPRRLPVVPIVLGVIALLGVIAVIASRADDDNSSSTITAGVEETRPVVVTGDPLEPHGDGQDGAVGVDAPELDGANFDGSAVRIAADGRPKVLVFLAHWCPHCQREVPVLANWLATNGMSDDVDLYGIATNTTPDRPNYPPSAWLERERFTIPTLADDAEGSAARAFGLSGFPYFVALDANNRVVARTSGELTVDQWEALIDQARTGGEQSG